MGSAPFKLCQSAADCIVEAHTTDCCGSVLKVGVAASEKSAFEACEAPWDMHFPPCGCAPQPDHAEDGNTVMPGEVVSVVCTDFTPSGGICKTVVKAASPCPASAPVTGAPCMGNSMCTYGDNPVADCRTRFACVNGAFQNQTTGSVCPMPGQGGCPATDPMNGDACGSPGAPELICGFPDAVVCACATCVGGPLCAPNQPETWHCAGAPSDPACPAQLPNAGGPCGAPSTTTCTYGLPCGGGGQSVQCTGGYWQWVLTPCPG